MFKGCPMSHTNNTESQSKTTTVRPLVTSYDGHEHSIEHWIELRMMVEEFEEETVLVATPRALAARA
jgi:hypothetical protein